MSLEPASVGGTRTDATGEPLHQRSPVVQRLDDGRLASAVDRSLSWVSRAVSGDDVTESVAFFLLEAREQFLAIEELRTLTRLAIELSRADSDVFVELSCEGLRAWLTSPIAPVLDGPNSHAQ